MDNRRNGKVARLPKAVRQMVNEMLDEGSPYDTIIQKLGEVGYPGFNRVNIHRWKIGGYREFQIKEEHRQVIRRDNVAMVTDEADVLDMDCGNFRLVSRQFAEALYDFDARRLGETLNQHPERYFQFMLAYARVLKNRLILEELIDKDDARRRNIALLKRRRMELQEQIRLQQQQEKASAPESQKPAGAPEQSEPEKQVDDDQPSNLETQDQAAA